jgi:hypothetical protein
MLIIYKSGFWSKENGMETTLMEKMKTVSIGVLMFNDKIINRISISSHYRKFGKCIVVYKNTTEFPF